MRRMTDVVIVGAGGFGREVRDWFMHWADAQRMAGHRWNVLGFLDDGHPHAGRLSRIGAEHLGPLERLGDMPGVLYYIGIGDPGTRARIAERADRMGARPGPAFAHPSAVVGSDVRLGDGTILCPGVLMTTNVQIGRHVHLNIGCTVGHDAVIGDFVTVNPGATISGDVILEPRAMVGTNAAINQGVRVGSGAVIGSGAAAVKDIPSGVVAVGVPAKPR
jgi:sugar O-acyltransferase (sialic acid O-acetyltransferase NeuD family)